MQNWSKICAKFAIQISARDLRRFREEIKIEIKTLYRAIRDARARPRVRIVVVVVRLRRAKRKAMSCHPSRCHLMSSSLFVPRS